MKLRRLLTLALAAAFVIVAPVTAKADTTETEGWKQNSKGTWYQTGVDETGAPTYHKDGIYPVDDPATEEVENYYFDKSGYVQKGWVKVDKVRDAEYDENGNVIRKQKTSYWLHTDANGVLQDEWQYLGGKWYYFDPYDYAMVEDCTYGIREGEDAKEPTYYHFAPSGEMTTGWYYHDTTGTYDDAWYYSDSHGVVKTGWQYIGGKWYFFEKPYSYDSETGEYYYPNYQIGKMYAGYYQPLTEYKFVKDENGMVTREKEATYYFADNGAMVTGWHNYASSNSVYGMWVYTDASGKAYDGWKQSGNAWYYINNGKMLTNSYLTKMKLEDGTKEYWLGYNGDSEDALGVYYVGRDGAMITGWYNASYTYANGDVETAWKYASADGTIKAQWVQSGADWYFVDSWGDMVTSCAETCIHDGANRELITKAYYAGEYTYEEYKTRLDAWDDAHTYVFGTDGKMVTAAGWYKYTSTSGTSWVYANADGTALTGWVCTDGVWYYCDGGYMLTNRYTPDGYFVGANGAWVK